MKKKRILSLILSFIMVLTSIFSGNIAVLNANGDPEGEEGEEKIALKSAAFVEDDDFKTSEENGKFYQTTRN